MSERSEPHDDSPQPFAADTNGKTLAGPAITRVRALAALDADWNSYGADPVAGAAMNAAEHLLLRAAHQLGTRYQEPWSVHALPDGGVALVWRVAGSELLVEIADSGAVGGLLVADDEPQCELEHASSDQVVQLLSSLTEESRVADARG